MTRRKMREIDFFFVVIANQLKRILHRGHHAQAQQIDFDDAHVGAIFFIPLHHYAPRHGSGLQWDNGIQTSFTNNHAARMLP